MRYACIKRMRGLHQEKRTNINKSYVTIFFKVFINVRVFPPKHKDSFVGLTVIVIVLS